MLFFEISSKQFIAFLLWEQIEKYVGPCMNPFGYPTGRVLARFPACTAVGARQLSSRFSPPSTASFANAVADNRYNHTKEHERRTEFALCWNITKAVQEKKQTFSVRPRSVSSERAVPGLIPGGLERSVSKPSPR
jgi:hypothetical protein